MHLHILSRVDYINIYFRTYVHIVVCMCMCSVHIEPKMYTYCDRHVHMCSVLFFSSESSYSVVRDR